MEARKNAARAGMELECLVDGHFGSKVLLIHRSASLRYRRAVRPTGCGCPEPREGRSTPVSRILFPRVGDDHLSGALVTGRLDATLLVRTGRPLKSSDLASGGVYPSARHRALRELLPHDFTLAGAEASGGMFLWHFPSSRPDRTLSCTLPV